MEIHFEKLTEPAEEVVDVFNRWRQDPDFVSKTEPNQERKEPGAHETITVQGLVEKLKCQEIYLIYEEDHIIGDVNYMVDPEHLFKKEKGTAWIGISIGEAAGRGRGIGFQAMQFIEEQIRLNGLKRIELGVFEFNTKAKNLYHRLGYTEIGRIEDFTYANGRMWSDIRMEKYL
ncbi:GNAT family N-acetyltransferase [Sporosarcina cascadiensis]|uniref:GNAT family N-acetyltransferase n=1 Tax=Sporosarcina cascadiensis TaxID=2660747 RepID=UPI00129B3124|nr:GNAT family N-acetyltransferase [Sporosarcina cascadiensis]